MTSPCGKHVAMTDQVQKNLGTLFDLSMGGAVALSEGCYRIREWHHVTTQHFDWSILDSQTMSDRLSTAGRPPARLLRIVSCPEPQTRKGGARHRAACPAARCCYASVHAPSAAGRTAPERCPGVRCRQQQ
eukprot:323293-Chlamydomonas_euryale.AAC.6